VDPRATVVEISTGGIVTRDEVTGAIVAARLAQGVTWQELAELIGKPAVWTTSALLGQHPLPPGDAKLIVDALGLDPAVIPVLGSVPVRGSGPELAADPTVYRFHEALSVYGAALKELIHEQFGDGIMSAINFSVNLEKKELDGAARVVVTFDGKFLPYDWTAAP
jgi:cyanate lyase